MKKKVKKITYKEALRRLEGKKKKKRRKKKIHRKPKSVKPRVYIGKDPLDQLFESQAKVKLLKFCFRNAEDSFELKEIFKRLRKNPAVLRQEMKKLEKVGLIKQKKAWLVFRTKQGKIRKIKKTIFYLSPGFDYFIELRDLVLRSTVASKEDLVKDVNKLGKIKLLILNGVFTRNPSAAADLLIVGDRISSKKLNNFLKGLEAEVGRELKCAVMTTKEFNYRYDMYDRFVRDLISEGGEVLIKKLNLW